MEGTMSFACYCLASETGRTYVGFSVNLDRRLRQHNGELVGGAKATKGGSWKRICCVTGFPTQQAALQFEWKWKSLTRTQAGSSAVERRCLALETLLNSEQSTSNAHPFSTYEGPLTVWVEDERASRLRDKEMRYGIVLE
jgi:structure-specific endonuclease subunit SLX1